MITRRIPSPSLVRTFSALRFCPYSLTSAANGTNSSSGTGSGSSKKNEAIVGTVPKMDALVSVAMAAVLGAMAVTF
jgi:hypothetical protein